MLLIQGVKAGISGLLMTAEFSAHLKKTKTSFWRPAFCFTKLENETDIIV